MVKQLSVSISDEDYEYISGAGLSPSKLLQKKIYDMKSKYVKFYSDIKVIGEESSEKEDINSVG